MNEALCSEVISGYRQTNHVTEQVVKIMDFLGCVDRY